MARETPRLINQGRPWLDCDGVFQGASGSTGKDPTRCVSMSHTPISRGQVRYYGVGICGRLLPVRDSL